MLILEGKYDSGWLYFRVNMRLSNGIPCYWLIRPNQHYPLKHIPTFSDAPKESYDWVYIGLYPMISPSNPHKIPVKSP